MIGGSRLVENDVSVGQDEAVLADDEAGPVARRHSLARVKVSDAQVFDLENKRKIMLKFTVKMIKFLICKRKEKLC